jgi:hypothetical protein
LGRWAKGVLDTKKGITYMIFRSPVALLFSIATLSWGLSHQAEAKTNVEASLKTSYASRDAAFMKKDVKGTLTPYIAQAIFINSDGEQTKGMATQREGLSKLFASDTAFSSAKTEIQEFIANKNGKEATTKIVRHIAIEAKPGADQTQPTVVDESVRDHWVSGPTGWHITQERRLTDSSLLELCLGTTEATPADQPVKNSLVGTWVGSLPSRSGTPAQETVIFRADGTESQTIVAPRQNISIQATYTTKDNILTQTLVSGIKNGRVMPNAGQVQNLNYRIEGDTLFLTLGAGSDELQFTWQPD